MSSRQQRCVERHELRLGGSGRDIPLAAQPVNYIADQCGDKRDTATARLCLGVSSAFDTGAVQALLLHPPSFGIPHTRTHCAKYIQLLGRLDSLIMLACGPISKQESQGGEAQGPSIPVSFPFFGHVSRTSQLEGDLPCISRAAFGTVAGMGLGGIHATTTPTPLEFCDS